MVMMMKYHNELQGGAPVYFRRLEWVNMSFFFRNMYRVSKCIPVRVFERKPLSDAHLLPSNTR